MEKMTKRELVENLTKGKLEKRSKMKDEHG